MKVKHVLENWSGVRRFICRQTSEGNMSVTLESPDRRPRNLGQLQNKLESVLEGYPVTIETVDEIPGNLAGKHRWVVSELADALGPAES